MHLSPDERIELRIAVNMRGVSIEDAAKAYGVSCARVRDLCNIVEDKKGVDRNAQTMFRHNASVLEFWPELYQWLERKNLNLAALSRICGLKPNVITNAMISGRFFRGKYENEILAIMQHTGLPYPDAAKKAKEKASR